MGKSALTRLKESLKEAGVIGSSAKSLKRNSKKSKNRNTSNMSDIKSRIKSVEETKMNPFELKFAKLKHNVVGRKMKGVQGKPGLTRKMGEEQRDKTLGVELQRKYKEGGIVDRRFGEHDKSMSVEDKMMQRFVKERQKKSKTSLYNLNDDDDAQMELTHMGQSLSTISFNKDSFETLSDDEADKGYMNQDLVSRLNFGGFEDSNENENGEPKTRKQIMEEIIAKSKLHRYERQKIREENEQLRLELDQEYEAVKALLNSQNHVRSPQEPVEPSKASKILDPKEKASLMRQLLGDQEYESHMASKTLEAPTQPPKTPEDYDVLVRTLSFDRRARPTDRLKTEEEILSQQVEKLKSLDEQRRARMMGMHEMNENGKRRRNEADDLGDEYFVDMNFGSDDGDSQDDEEQEEEEDLTLRYNDEGVLVNDRVFVKKLGPGPRVPMDEEDDDDSEEESDEGDNEEDGDDSEEEGSEEADDHEEEEAIDDDEEMVDGQMQDDEDEIAELEATEQSDVEVDEQSIDHASPASENTTAETTTESQVAYTYPCPQTHEEFLSILSSSTTTKNPLDISVEDLKTILHRIRLLHHEKLGGRNKFKLMAFFDTLVDHVFYIVQDLCDSESQDEDTTKFKETLELIIRHLSSLTQVFPTHAAHSLLSRLYPLFTKFTNTKSAQPYPSFKELIQLKLVGWLFPTSDSSHDLVDGVMALIGKMLHSCRPRVSESEDVLVQDICTSLFMIQMVYEWMATSKRWVPEAYNNLHLILSFLILDKDVNSREDVAGFFPMTDVEIACDKLRISEQDLEEVGEQLPILNILSLLSRQSSSPLLKITPQLKLSILNSVLSLLEISIDLYTSTSCFAELYTPTITLLSRFEECTQVNKVLEKLRQGVKSGELRKRYLQMQKFKPTPIATFVPKFDEEYSLDRKSSRPLQQQTDKLRAQYKKEFKGALRELRKDASYVLRKKLEETKKKSDEYKKWERGVIGQLGMQEGEARQHERNVKKAKK